MIATLLVISGVLNIALLYSAYISVNKIEVLEKMYSKLNTEYEETVKDFYSRTSIILHTMRAIDEKQMFEKDDVVGGVFAQLVDTVNDLYVLLYGSSTVDEETT